MTRFPLLLSATVLCACGAAQVGPGAGGNAEQFEAASSGGATLSVTTSLDAIACSATGPVATFSGVATVTDWLDAVTIYALIDGVNPFIAGAISPRDFTGAGTLTAPYSLDVPFPEGTHSILLSFSMSGAGSQVPLDAEAGPFETFAMCSAPEESTCSAESGFFGELSHDVQIACSGHGGPELQVQVRGDLGDDAVLAVTGADGYRESLPLLRSGESCNYHAKWDVSGPGTFTLIASGHGQSVETHVAVTCR